MSTRGKYIRGAGGLLKRNNDLGVGIGAPHGGDEGDIRVRMVDGSPHLYAKAGGEWYGINMSSRSSEELRLGSSSSFLNIKKGDIEMTGKISLLNSETRNVCVGVNNANKGADNICIGTETGRSMAVGAINNVCIGTNAGYTLSTSDDNVMIGKDAGYSVSTGNGDNVLIGRNCGYYMSTGYDNVFIGDSAGKGVSGTALTGDSNVAIGDLAMYVETVGTDNVAIGYRALYDSQGGDGNVAIGYKSGENITDGHSNTFVGKDSGANAITGDYNTCIGIAADVSSANAFGQTVIGLSLTGDASTWYDGSTAGTYTTTMEGFGGFYLKGGVATDSTGFASACLLSLDSKNENVDDGDVLGAIQFRTPNETSTGDAQLPGAAIWAEAVATFGSGSNRTALVFALGNSNTALATANEKMRITDTGRVGIGNASPAALLDIQRQATEGTAPLEVLRLSVKDVTNDQDMEAGEGPSIDFYIAESAITEFAGRLAVVREESGDAAVDAAMVFHTSVDGSSPSEKMRIDSTGRVGIGTVGTTPADLFHVIETQASNYVARIEHNDGSNPRGIQIKYGTAINDPGKNFLLCTDGTTRLAIRSNGGLSNFQSNDTDLSDERLKKDIADAPDALDKINSFKVRTYKYKDQSNDKVHTGLMAQEAELVDSSIVNNSGWGEDDDYKSIYNKDVMFKMLKAIQELSAKLDIMQTEINTLKEG